MVNYLSDPQSPAAKPVWLMPSSHYQTWLAGQPDQVRNWLEGIGFKAKAQQTVMVPGTDGVAGALAILSEPAQLWDFASLRQALASGAWRLDAAVNQIDWRQATLGWALASYHFDRYRTREAKTVQIAVPATPASAHGQVVAEAVYLARDLINTPANELGPAELAEACGTVADRFGARLRTIEGISLLTANYPAIHAVGQASSRPPRLIELLWGDERAPKLTLIGKGVCFDTGGLDLKPSANMQLMKKDMGGAAVALGLAQAVMALRLPVRLRLLIAAVENSVGSNAFRPSDVIRTRKGLTVEIGNTDAEGRLILADLLAEGDREQPALMLDFATLTGAARVALGPDLPALFTPDDALAEELLAAGRRAEEPLWRLPLHAAYREMIDSAVADLNNAGTGNMAGAITAALFLQDFVTETRAWAHLDIYAWNSKARPGRPIGGEATGLRALLAAIEQRFAA